MILGRTRQAFLITTESVAIAAFLVMLGASILQVTFRYVIDLPLMWTEELARLMCVFTTYFGSVVALLQREHIRVDLIDGMLGPRGQLIASVASNILVICFLVVFAVGCWLMAAGTRGMETATMPWFLMAYVYYGVGIAVVIMIAIVTVDVISNFIALARRRAAP
jgi:TRAP-type C4-dicarboxylate transport system permease small subunit